MWNREPPPPFQSTLNHFAVQQPDGDLWIVAYQVPGTTCATVLEDGHTEASAKARARALNFPRMKPVRRDWKPEKAVYAPAGL